MTSRDRHGLVVGDGDDDLDERLSAGLDEFNLAATGVGDQRRITVRVDDADGELVGGLRGWTWGTCAGISMVWIREDARGDGWGRRLLAAAEQVARERGCRQVVVSSFTFQAPAFYERCGYVETGRVEGLPLDGMADVQFRKRLVD
jgi:GNAT superfamily N-acetyltransferase